MHILIYLGPSAVAISRLIPRADEYCETCQFLYLSPCFVKISHTPGFISLMEQFTPPTMRGEGDRKNDARFLNTLKYNPNIGSPVPRVLYWVLREVTVEGILDWGGVALMILLHSDTLTEMIQIVKTDIFSPPPPRTLCISGSRHTKIHMTNSIRRVRRGKSLMSYAIDSTSYTLANKSRKISFCFLFLFFLGL